MLQKCLIDEKIILMLAEQLQLVINNALAWRPFIASQMKFFLKELC